MKKKIFYFCETVIKCIVYILLLKMISKFLSFDKYVIDIFIMSSTIMILQSDIIKFFNNQINIIKCIIIFLTDFIAFMIGMYIFGYIADVLLIIHTLICVVCMLTIELVAKRVVQRRKVQ